MTKVQKSNPGLPSRTDSFLRMLELEKMYKMQRIQGHAPATIASPSTSSPPAQPNKPFKARRASGHPPLSHQTQIMKAVRRSSALPSLSISIPPSPAEDSAVGTDGIPGVLPSKEERTKTVKFTSPGVEDDGDSSDHSSICQSPSWEQYGRNKKKKPKKRDPEPVKKGKEEKPASTLKKKGNRLSKVPPSHVQGVGPLTADRAQSAPELDLYLKANAARVDIPGPASSSAMANPKVDSKPKSKGFLSNFRIQHGNVSTVQKLIDGQRTSIDGTQQVKPQSGASRVDPRKPPSISSAISNSTRSISSLDQLPPSARNSSGSNHGRSQSLLTSTLNKLKGPSYLYYSRPTEASNNAQSQRPSSARDQDMEPHWLNEHSIRQPVEKPVEKKPERPKERPMTSDDHTQKLPEFTFPPKPKRVTTQLTPDTVARTVQDQARLDDSKDASSGYESPEPTSFRSRRNQVPHARVPNREQPAEKERRLRPDRASRALRQPVESSDNGEDRTPQARQPKQPNREFEPQYRTSRQNNGYVQPQVEAWVESKHGPEPTPSSQRVANHDNENSSEPEGKFSRDDEDDQMSVDTHASTIRPVSRKQGHSSPGTDGTDGRKHVTFPSNPSMIGRAVTSDPVYEAHKPQATVTEPPKREKPAKVEEFKPAGKPLRLDKSADYFSFISQSYAPPALELRSPLESKFPSPRIEEEPEEYDDLDHILRHIPVRRHVEEIPTPPESTNHAISSNSNAASRVTKQRLPKNSPSMSSHYSDSDVPALERLGISPKAARILAGADTSSTSTSTQSNTDPSRTSSERSSSSTCDDLPPSPPMAPTPDSSRPQSHKEFALSQTNATSGTTTKESINDDERTPRMNYRSPAVEQHTSRSTSREADIQDDSWSRTALPIDIDSHAATTSDDKLNGHNSNPKLIATPTQVTFTGDVKEIVEEELISRNPYPPPVLPRAQSALDVHSTSFLPDIKNQSLYARKAKAGVSSISLPNSPPAELVEGGPRKSTLRSRKNSSNIEENSALISTGAAYLQEARKTVPVPPVPTSRALRPTYTHKNSSTNIKSAGTPEGRADPLAKMLVECCNCKFFHDMPSRVYECMAKPDSLVEDKLLGVSATITTMVKCPWCAHGMTTQCCSGYAAIVYLKEKLHGK
ncbi:hypothetical protein F4804DRAFT_333287 [Jackrogersella minutella]|nr:hypothetical protein F4804DRAFT_333287 [Jackrogersella minutella]